MRLGNACTGFLVEAKLRVLILRILMYDKLMSNFNRIWEIYHMPK
jgi:hypothetical protein